jgi:hypothetical protein
MTRSTRPTRSTTRWTRSTRPRRWTRPTTRSMSNRPPSTATATQRRHRPQRPVGAPAVAGGRGRHRRAHDVGVLWPPSAALLVLPPPGRPPPPARPATLLPVRRCRTVPACRGYVPGARTTTLPEATSGRRWRATGWWSRADRGRPDTPLCAGSARPPPRLGCRRRSWRPSRLPTSRDDAVRPGRTASSGVIVRVGCGEADGVAAGFAASGDVDELVDQPQAEGRPRKGIVG